jgi:hypothetical protein
MNLRRLTSMHLHHSVGAGWSRGVPEDGHDVVPPGGLRGTRGEHLVPMTLTRYWTMGPDQHVPHYVILAVQLSAHDDELQGVGSDVITAHVEQEGLVPHGTIPALGPSLARRHQFVISQQVNDDVVHCKTYKTISMLVQYSHKHVQYVHI